MFILCLGANVELELERCLPDLPGPLVTVGAESNPPVSQGVVAPGTVDEGPGQKEAKGSKQKISKNLDPKGKRKGKGKEKAVVPQLPKEKPKPKPKPTVPPHERLKINMVHGDVLILSGGDYLVRLSSWIELQR